jgi:tetratricopeptide (TPR) repeat protein
MDEPGKWGVELLLKEADELYADGRAAEALRAAQRGTEGARELGDLGLEIKTAWEEARDLRRLGDHAAALSRLTWILGVAADPSLRVELERAGVTPHVAAAYGEWAHAARFLPAIPLERLLAVLDAGEAYVRSVGRPGWRAGLLLARAGILDHMGRRDDALGIAEEGLSLKLRNGRQPGATEATYRWALGDLLRQANRPEDGRMHYQAVLDDSESASFDRLVAMKGLARCTLAQGDASNAKKLEEEAVRLASGMGDGAAAGPLEVLIEVCRSAGDLRAAQEVAECALQGARRLKNPHYLYHALRNAANVALDENDPVQARALLDEAEQCAEALDRQAARTVFRPEIQAGRARLAKLVGGDPPPSPPPS